MMFLAMSNSNPEEKVRFATDAELAYITAIEGYKKARELKPDSIEYWVWHAKSLSNLALLTGEDEHRASEAVDIASESITHSRNLIATYPDEIDSRECLAVSLTNKGELLYSQGNSQDALPLFREALKYYTGLARQVPAFLEFPWSEAMARSNLGATLAELGEENWDEAKELLIEAREIYEQLINKNPDNPELRKYDRKKRETIASPHRISGKVNPGFHESASHSRSALTLDHKIIASFCCRHR